MRVRAHLRSTRVAHEQLVILAHSKTVAPAYRPWVSITSGSVGVVAMIDTRIPLLVRIRVLTVRGTAGVWNIGIVIVGPVSVVVVRHDGQANVWRSKRLGENEVREFGRRWVGG